jgi:tRNA G10  N-methylase Trm11
MSLRACPPAALKNVLQLIHADARRIPLANETVQCVVTSPPYWGLRKYKGEQELIWGGDPLCPHSWQRETFTDKSNWESFTKRDGSAMKSAASIQWSSGFDRAFCSGCGAIGLRIAELEERNP